MIYDSVYPLFNTPDYGNDRCRSRGAFHAAGPALCVQCARTRDLRGDDALPPRQALCGLCQQTQRTDRRHTLAGQPLEDIILSADGAIYNNAAQAWNHEFLFEEFSPNPQAKPSGELLEAINRDFGSFDELKVQMNRAAAGLFGSGWVWLAEDPSGRLAIVSEQNAGNPMRHGMKPLLTFDVWEHAYYIDYRNRRADAVDALWGIVDWKVVGDRYAKK